MSEEITNITENSEAERANGVEENYTPEQKKENEEAYNVALEHLNSYGLNWTFRSIRYIIDKENIGFAQLRSCVHMVGDRAVFDFLKSAIFIIKAGLIGSKQLKETDTQALEDKAYEIVEDWRENVGSISSLHIMLINVMERKNFFMGTADLKILQHLSLKNFEKSLVSQMIQEDVNEKIGQAEAIAKSY